MERHAPLISCETLFANLEAKDWVIFDCRYKLGDAEWGPKEYAKRHIPGARHAHVDRDLSGPVGTGGKGRHPLPIVQSFVRFLRFYGVNQDTQIVCYDDEMGQWASRLWWLCKHYGLEHVAVLDGGLKRWRSLGLPVTDRHEPAPVEGNFAGEPGHMPITELDEIEAMVDAGNPPLVDARATERYTGEVEPVDAKAGHIPGARNKPFPANVNPEGLFLSPDELYAKYEDYVGHTVYCGSGVTATHNVLAMAVAELPIPPIFPGSWSQWCRPAANREIATGTSQTSKPIPIVLEAIDSEE